MKSKERSVVQIHPPADPATIRIDNFLVGHWDSAGPNRKPNKWRVMNWPVISGLRSHDPSIDRPNIFVLLSVFHVAGYTRQRP
jgi:hypothetical protein